jgi:aldehyde:ferredoxin oxidoreductase
MSQVIKLVREADDLGVDSISIGSAIAFAIEAYKKKLIKEEDLDGIKPDWGDASSSLDLMHLIVEKKNFGKILAAGVRYASLRIGGESVKFSMHVKGLPITAYDCHVAPGMALAFGTSSIGAHHKEAWIIAWEAQYGFDKVDKVKVEKVVELQRIRGGWFETFVTCRLPWVEVNLSLNYYPQFLEYSTGMKYTPEDLNRVADRIYTLIRAFWIREYGYWMKSMDIPPMRWFEEPLTNGPRKGAHLSLDAYNKMLETYYEIRGWDKNGIPRRSTFDSLGLSKEAREIEALGVSLKP